MRMRMKMIEEARTDKLAIKVEGPSVVGNEAGLQGRNSLSGGENLNGVLAGNGEGGGGAVELHLLDLGGGEERRVERMREMRKRMRGG